MKKDDGEAGFFAKERWECTGKAESHTLEKWKKTPWAEKAKLYGLSFRHCPNNTGAPA